MLVPVVAMLPASRTRAIGGSAALVALATMAPAILLAIRTAAQPNIIDGALLR